MIRFAPLIALVALAACDRAADHQSPPPARSPAAEGDIAAQLANDPRELAALRRRCRADRDAVGADTCEAVARATRMRFMGGGPSAYAPGVVSGDVGGGPSNGAE